MNDRDALVAQVRNSIIGNDRLLDGPFGPRLVTYADYTASGRSLAFIEDFLRDHVIPTYANTHSESSGTGLQTTRFREDARAIIHAAVGGSDEDVAIFCGSGATAAVNKLVDILNIRLPADLDDRYKLRNRIAESERPVVFVGPYEHHSNELPWRESIADVIGIREDADGRPDRGHLREMLAKYSERELRIGSFSAASNVTGIGSGARELSVILHEHDALAFFDFAAAAPYMPIRMNGTDEHPLDYKDAVFLSPHKFIGGPGTPGVLVVKKRLLTNRVPSVPGGGTVAYVGPEHHHYLKDPVMREEGGTPDILGSIRAGLAFQLKEAVGAEWILEHERALVQKALERWSTEPNLEILGNLDSPRLSIVSFLVRFGDRYLHHGFVVSLLNDLFGIQARGGCSCAGPYGHRLLHIDSATSADFEAQILRGCEGIKPGWTRVNFNYFVTKAEFEFVLDAVAFVAREGWRFLPLYEFSAKTSLWKHRASAAAAPLRLHDVKYRAGRLEYADPHRTCAAVDYEGYLKEAQRLTADASQHAAAAPAPAPASICKDEEFERLRWFPLPHEVSSPPDSAAG